MTYAEYIVRWKTPAYRIDVVREATRIKADGCSGVPDFFLIICDEHDIHYSTHRDFFTQKTIKQEDADRCLKYGIQYFSWFGRWSPMAWWRYRVLSRRHLGLGTNAWRTGPQRARERMRTVKAVSLIASTLLLAGCVESAGRFDRVPVSSTPYTLDKIMVNEALCHERGKTLRCEARAPSRVDCWCEPR